MAETIFGKIIRGAIPAQKVWEDEHCIAIRDINPVSPVHLLVIPRKEIASLEDARAEDKALLGHLTWVATELARKEKIDQKGYRLVWNCGAHGQQSVDHIHLHVLGGRQMEWPPG
jgi:histidine triad (HIT) family protein